MSNEILEIIALCSNSDFCQVYLSDGTIKTFSSNDPVTKKIIESALPQLSKTGRAKVTISEEKVNIKEWLKEHKIELVSIYKEVLEALKEQPDFVEELRKIAKEYIADTPINEKETVVAITEGKKIVEDVHKLDTYLKHNALAQTEVTGYSKLIERLSNIKREHTVQDVINFLEYADLPLADNGDIIAYKLLDRTSEPGVFVDCYTGKIKQSVGSYVFMDASLVDPDRSQSCSCGLHIARRAYLQDFHGNVCVLVRIKPEDIITVPYEDANKVRVCAYHIIGVLSQNLFELVKSNKPMTSLKEGEELLSKAIRGDHIGITNTVQITQNMGNGLIYKKIKPEKKKVTRKNTKKGEAKAFDDKENISKEEKEALIKLATSYESPKKVFKETIKKSNLTKDDAKLLISLKKRMKKGWKTLGVSDALASKIEKLIK
jgi:hypothetical protein